MYHGTDGDLRNLWRRGSGMTLRRLNVLLMGLPPTARLWRAMEQEEQRSMKPTVEQLRAREQHYRNRGGGS